MLKHQLDVTNVAKDIIKNGKILVDIRVESEDSRFMNVLKDGVIYFIRFMGDDCYALVTMEECEKLPVKTTYKGNGPLRYDLYGSKSKELGFKKEECFLINSSDNWNYLVETNKHNIYFYEWLYVYDNLLEGVVQPICKSDVEGE